jgi:signal transduction histidine kinase
MFSAMLLSYLVTRSIPEWLSWATNAALLTVPAAFLAGMLRSRLARGGLAELFRELGGLRGERLQAGLAKSLGDPGLVLAYHEPGSNRYLDVHGDALALPAARSGRPVAAVERDGRKLGALLYDPSLDDDPELVQAVSAAAAIALDNERVQAESAARLAELHASRERIVSASDTERRRLERNLHDGAQQRLVALRLQLGMLQGSVREDPALAEQLAAAGDEVMQSLEELRELARGIHPAVLDHGLDAALESLAARSAVATSVSLEGGDALSKPVELAAYFVVCEALANVAKYARATRASVRVSRRDGFAVIEIADDGVGGADESTGSGLRGLADRVAALDGTLRITSPLGRGTVVTAQLPCGS